MIKAFWALLILPLCFIGCATAHVDGLNVSYRMAGVENGDSVFIVSINGKTYEHKSSDGGIKFFENNDKTIIRVRVGYGRGTYYGGEIDYFYHIGDKGQVTLLGNLKESWYEDEAFVSVNLDGFKPVAVRAD